MSTRDPGTSTPAPSVPNPEPRPPAVPPAAPAEVVVQAAAAALPEPAAPVSQPRGPLGAIALSLSGGGYRAAGFHLGVLRFLDRVGLLPSLAALSTVSGGTIVGAAWVVSVLEKKPFEEFFSAFSTFLKKTNVIREALDHLTATRSGGQVTTPSLIRSAASVYARPDFLGDRRFREILDARPFPLDEVIFNSTEFHSGIDFRFRRSGNPGAVVGNGNFGVPGEVAANLRLADVTAASSCFPSAFEPFLFPDHFDWPASFPLRSVRDALGETFAGGLPLMDGGIYDNQGVGALVLAYDKAADPPVLLISDTSPPQDRMYDYPAPRRRGWLTLNVVQALAYVVFVLALVSVIGLVVTAVRDGHPFTVHGIVLYGLPLLTSAMVAGGLVWAHRQIGSVRKMLRSDVRIDNAWSALRSLTVSDVVSLLQLRISSLVALTSSVFMNRVRGLIFSGVYSDPRYKDRRISNLIYTLTLSRPAIFKQYPWLRPGARLRERAVLACEVATALWLASDDQLTLLVEVGEATTCFALIKYIVTLPGERQNDPAVAALLARLRKEWEVMNAAAPGA